VDTLRSGWLTTGPKTKRFEREFAERVGIPYALAVNYRSRFIEVASEINEQMLRYVVERVSMALKESGGIANDA